ncbi:MAG TPA: DUF6677 family protein [Acidobacteriota bacterium]|nr:DUF6677 family protein [Acidobacteriota bacterium]
METGEITQEVTPVPSQAGLLKTAAACVAGVLVPGLGHALLNKWDRAVVFFGSISAMFFLGLRLHARLFSPDFSDFFAILKFAADAGSGLLYWISWLWGLGQGDPAAYAYDFGNVFVYVAGLLNMLVVVDAFDIAMGRKQ